MIRFKEIIVPTDFSSNAGTVYSYVRWLADKNDSRVDLIHVIPKISYLQISEEVMGDPFKVQEKYRQLRHTLKERLKKELTENVPLNNRGQVFINGEVKVAQGIKGQTEKKDYDLLVIGSQGQGKAFFKRGSVTLQLIRLAQVPVLSLNKAAEPNIKTIVVPTDGSKISLTALSTAVNIALKAEARIILYSVFEFDFNKITSMGGDPSLYDYVERGQRKEVFNNLKEVIKDNPEMAFKGELTESEVLIDANDHKPVKLKITFSHSISAHTSIVDYAHKNADLVVMATHGRSGITKLLIGSVAEKVVRHLDCPILTLKPDFAKK